MSNEIEFEYTGIEKREEVPRDVAIVHSHSSVTEVTNGMFRECYRLKRVVLNEGLQKIGSTSFYDCTSLEHINLPSTLIEIGSLAFSDCGNILEIVLNEGLQKIGDSSFWRCSLKSITFPSTITKASDRAFCWCSKLKTVILNEGLQTICKSAFSGCASLEHITIPSTVDEIDAFTFCGCQRLREVGLHEGVHNIASNAFQNCPSLERFTFPDPSIRMDNIIRVGQTEVENKVDQVRGQIIERSGSELFVSVSSPLGWINWQGGDWKTVKELLGRINRLLTYYELREATTLLELAIWKAKMDQVEAIPLINRDEYRVDIPGPVKNTILQFLNFRVNYLVDSSEQV